MTKKKSTREILAFESWMFIFGANDFSLERKVYRQNFEFVDNARDIQNSIVTLTVTVTVGRFLLILSSSFQED